MDRPMLNLLARVVGALAFGAFLLHAGQHLTDAYPADVSAGGWVAIGLILVLAVAAAWAQARLNAKRPALIAALVLTGALPVGAFLLHRAPLDAPHGYGIVLVLNLVFGLLALAFTGWLLAKPMKDS